MWVGYAFPLVRERPPRASPAITRIAGQECVVNMAPIPAEDPNREASERPIADYPEAAPGERTLPRARKSGQSQ